LKLDPSAFVADQELIQAFEKRSAPVQCEADRVLFTQGDAPRGLFILLKGEATLTMNSQAGDEIMRIQANPGSLLGLPGLVGNEPYTLTATARKGAELSFLRCEDFSSLMQTDPCVSFKVLQVLAAEVRSARRALREL